MKFKKIDDHKIRCIISQEEMEQRGILLDDFIEDRDKTEEFLREIVEQAHYELNMGPGGNAFNVQLSVMPEGGLCLLITEEKRVKESLEEFKECLEELRNAMSKVPTVGAKQQEGQTQGESAVHRYVEMPVWAKFVSLDDCIRVSRALAATEGIISSLYKEGEDYHMRFELHHLRKDAARVILAISEYSRELITEEHGGAYYLEHADCIIPRQAVETLQQLGK